MLNSTLGMDIWIGMAESAWISPECETTATHKQGKGKKSTLMVGQEKKNAWTASGKNTHGWPAGNICTEKLLQMFCSLQFFLYSF